MLAVGIVGLPNVGKSTLFNAITSSESAAAENYPFCTIDPNVGIVDVPDRRLERLAEIAGSEKIVRSAIKFVDIAGLVKGASQGEGLGNRFLSHIREVSAIAHVVRCFEDENIIHVDGSVDPIRDIETINLELIMADMEVLLKARDKQKKLLRTNKEAADILNAIELALASLERGEMLGPKEEYTLLRDYHLLTSKPCILVANVSERDLLAGNKYTETLEAYAASKGISVVRLSSQIEQEISSLPYEMRAEFLKDLGLEYSCLERLISESYTLLNLISFFTVGPKETRAWTISKGETAYEAAAQIHTDIQRGFIRAEVISYNDFVENRGHVREKGLLRLEGKSYIVNDGDIIHFRFNV